MQDRPARGSTPPPHPSETCSGCRRPRFVSRRQFLGWSALGLSGLALGPTALLREAGAASAGRRLVFINLYGGNDGTNTLVPYGLQSYRDARPGLALRPEELHLVDGLYGWHPSLAGLAQLMRDGSLAAIHQVGYPEPNLSHFESISIWSRGMRDLDSTTDRRGWIGRLADLYYPRPTDVVGLGVGPIEDLVTDTARPLNLQGIDEFNFYRPPLPEEEDAARRAVARSLFAVHEGEPGFRGGLAGSMERAYEFVEVIRSSVGRYRSTVTYPETGLGELLRDTARLIAADLGTRVIYTGFGGFDTHAAQVDVHAALLLELDGALSAFVRDLQEQREWDRTLVLVISEFGRTNFENGSGGTDHGFSNVLLLAGPRLRGRQFGPPLAEADLAEERPGVDYRIDFRSVYKEVLASWLGVDPEPVFPEPVPRPVRLGFL